jgi:hypothetical protein
MIIDKIANTNNKSHLKKKDMQINLLLINNSAQNDNEGSYDNAGSSSSECNDIIINRFYNKSHKLSDHSEEEPFQLDFDESNLPRHYFNTTFNNNSQIKKKKSDFSPLLKNSQRALNDRTLNTAQLFP